MTKNGNGSERIGDHPEVTGDSNPIDKDVAKPERRKHVSIYDLVEAANTLRDLDKVAEATGLDRNSARARLRKAKKDFPDVTIFTDFEARKRGHSTDLDRLKQVAEESFAAGIQRRSAVTTKR